MGEQSFFFRDVVIGGSSCHVSTSQTQWVIKLSKGLTCESPGGLSEGCREVREVICLASEHGTCMKLSNNK